MKKDARPSRRGKDEETSNSKEKHGSDKGVTTSSLPASDKFGLRRSSRETLGKKVAVHSSSSVRKSERLEKRVPTTPPEKGKPEKNEKNEKKSTPSPLRRSDRGKSCVSSSSVSKSSGKSSSSSPLKTRKGKKEKSVKQLTMETQEVGVSEKEDRNHNRAKPKRQRKMALDVRSYMKAFRTAKTVTAVEDDGGGKEASGLSVKPGCRNENGDVLGASRIAESTTPLSNDAMTVKINDEPETIEVNCSVERVNEPKSMDQRGARSDQEMIPSMRERIILDVDTVALGTSVSKEVCISNADDATPVLPSECIRSSPVEKVDTNSKRQRVDFESTGGRFSSDNANLNQELAVTSLTMDRREHEAGTIMGLAEKCDNHMQQESPRDLQTGCEQHTCFSCKLGGKLLCCHGRGCKRSYHPTCLDPPMDDVPLGIWYCLMCVSKKIESGVHSVSEGIESICDTSEVEKLDVDGFGKERRFYVKYKGLAHVHNLWVPESKLLLDAPSLVEKFNREGQVRWKPEWKVPQRLLQKRLLTPPKRHDQNLTNHAYEKLDGHYEWLVKWCGLDYENATWELDNALLFRTADGENLIKDYENRCNRVNGASSSKVDKILDSEKCSVKLPQLHSGILSQLHSNFLEYVNKLHEFWLKSQNAVVIDEQERITKVVSLIQSFQPKTCRPFLIISTLAALHLWDDEFLRLVNVVVYNGNKDLRRSIRNLEFNEGGCPMFQVLITTLDIVVEDMDVFRSTEWELIIIDESQCTGISPHCAEIKLLATKRRLLLVSGPLKESTAEYRNLLSLLEYPSDSQNRESLPISPSDSIGKLKERFSRYIVYQGKSGYSRFKEYWVPVQMSNVQLEQYCGTLISNSALLCASLKHDTVGALQGVLMSCRKCCNHPYIVDRNIQIMLTEGLKDAEIFNAGIKACGKLQLLEMMLLELQKRGLRALILFQECGRDSLGHILEDLLIQRFGLNSYERVDCAVQHNKKKNAVLNKFNDKEFGRFVFLLETRACLSSIKLSSVDTVIIYGSDWNPVNDVRALQKITLESKPEQIPLFRMYSPYTLEEKVLILAKQGKFLDRKLQNISLGTSHVLLMWGASHQFKTLDEFHADGLASSAKSLFKDPSLEEVMQGFLQIISSVGKDTESSTIVNVSQVGGVYRSESLLFGELHSEVMDEVQHHLFWTKMLEGKRPQWKYISSSSHRNRKRVQYSEESAKNTETETDEVVKKRKKLVNSRVDPPTIELGSDGNKISGCKEGAFGIPTDYLPNSLPRSTVCINETIHANRASYPLGNNFLEIPQDYNIESEERRKMRDAQKSLHLSLKPKILQLCKILKLSDLAHCVVEEFLEYVMNNHHVNRDEETILQAFQISLCWTVASLLKQKIDHKQSLALARQHLNFNCTKKEADYLYSMLRCLKRTFSYWTGKLKAVDSLKVPSLLTTDTPKDPAQAYSPQSMCSNKRKVKVGVEDCSDKDVLSQSERAAVFKLAEKDVAKSIMEIQKKFQKRLEKLVQKQEEEKNEIECSYEQEKLKIQQRQKTETAAIRSCFEHNTSMRVDKLKVVEDSFLKEFERLKKQRDMRLKNLEAKYMDTKRIMQDTQSRWVQEVESWARDELLGKPPLNEAIPWLKCSENSEQVRVEDIPDDSPVSGNLLKDQSPDKIVHRTPEIVASEAIICDHIEIPTAHDINENARLDTTASDNFSGSGFLEQNTTGPLGDSQVTFSTVPSAQMCIPDGTTLSTLDGKVMPEAPESGSPADVTEKFVSTKGSSCEECTLDESTSIIPGTVSSTNDVVNVDSVVQMSAEEQSPDRVTSNRPDGEISFSVLETTHPEVEVEHSSKESHEVCNVTSNSAPGINQQDRVDSAVNQNSLLQEPLLVNSSSVQPAVTLTRDDPVLPNQVHLDECNLPSISCEIQLGDTPPADKHNAFEQVEQSESQPVEIEPSNQSDHAFEHAAQVPLSPSNSPSSDNTADVPLREESEHQPSNEGSNAIQVSQAPIELVENPQFSNQAVSQHLTCSINPPIGTLGMHSPDSRTMSVASEFNYNPMQTMPAVASWVAPQSLPDPLQKELERICREFEKTSKSHEDMKLQLKSDCDKEIAQILQKYEMKHKEIDAEFFIKKKEFDDLHNKLWLNKVLAEAFRSKCMENKSSSRSGMLQDVNATFMQQLIQQQQSMQQNAQRPPAMVSTSTATSLVSTVPASGHELNPQPSLAAPQPSLPTPVISSRTSPMPTVNSSSAHFPSNTTRPPQISSLSYSTGSPHGGGHIRARPPHLRASATSLPSHSRGIQTQPTSSPAPTSNALPCLPPRLPSSTYQSGPCARATGPETTRELPASNLSLSALELLRNVDRGAAASQPVSLPAVPDLVTNVEQLNTSEFVQNGMPLVNSVSTGGATNVVYLSDDD